MTIEELYNEFCQTTGADRDERLAFLAGMCAAAYLCGSEELFRSAQEILMNVHKEGVG